MNLKLIVLFSLKAIDDLNGSNFCRTTKKLISSVFVELNLTDEKAALAYVFIGNSEHEVAALIVDFRNARPIVVADGVFVPQDDDAAGRQTEEVVHVVLALRQGSN